MKDITYFSASTVASFENDYNNMLEYSALLLNAANKNYGKYSAQDGEAIIRKQMNRIFGGDLSKMTDIKRMAAWRDHGKEWAALVEDVMEDKMSSGWDEGNARFMSLVDSRNIARGDKQEFYVEDASLMQVSKFASNHHDIVRQAVKPGKAFTVDTSWYTIKTYADFVNYATGRIDWPSYVQRMYDSIIKWRYDGLYTAFLSMDASLPADMVLETPVTEATKDAIIAQVEAVRAATGTDVMLVGTKVAISKLQNTVNYNMWSDNMKDEKNQNGLLGFWEGYECLALPRVNATGTRKEITDNTKILIVPVDPNFKPIKHITSGEVLVYESGMDGMKKDMTIDTELAYQEGVAVVVSQLFGVIKIK